MSHFDWLIHKKTQLIVTLAKFNVIPITLFPKEKKTLSFPSAFSSIYSGSILCQIKRDPLQWHHAYLGSSFGEKS